MLEAPNAKILRMSRAAECSPPLDVVETAQGLEVILDLPGVPASSLDIVFADNLLVIAGEKLPAVCEHADAGFHIAERGFGRFRRAIRVEGAYDGGRAAASLARGELRVVLPRIEERRGVPIQIPVR